MPIGRWQAQTLGHSKTTATNVGATLAFMHGIYY